MDCVKVVLATFKEVRVAWVNLVYKKLQIKNNILLLYFRGYDEAIAQQRERGVVTHPEYGTLVEYSVACKQASLSLQIF